MIIIIKSKTLKTNSLWVRLHGQENGGGIGFSWLARWKSQGLGPRKKGMGGGETGGPWSYLLAGKLGWIMRTRVWGEFRIAVPCTVRIINV